MADNESKKIKLQDSLRLNNLIKRLGIETITVSDNGEPITRFEQLARLIWDHALGFTRKDPKTGTDTIFFPDKTFISMIYNRIEGKIPVAKLEDDGKKATLADRVSDQTKSRLNIMAEDS